jgi:hypothetical protein
LIRLEAPGRQLVDAVDLIVSDIAELVGQLGLRIDAIQLGGFNLDLDDHYLGSGSIQGIPLDRKLCFDTPKY